MSWACKVILGALRKIAPGLLKLRTPHELLDIPLPWNKFIMTGLVYPLKEPSTRKVLIRAYQPLLEKIGNVGWGWLSAHESVHISLTLTTFS